MNYIGSKVSLLPFPEKHIPEFSGFPSPGTLVDIVVGTGAVGKHFRQPGWRIIATDIQYYSYCLNRAGIGLNALPDVHHLLPYLPSALARLFSDNVQMALDDLNGLASISLMPTGNLAMRSAGRLKTGGEKG